MIAEIGAGLSGLNAAMDLVKGLNAASNQASVNEVKIALQGQIFTAQNALIAAVAAQGEAEARARELEQQIMQFKNWESEKQRYELKDVGQGCLAYRLKPGMEGGEPPHAICGTCYEHGVKSLLNPRPLPGRIRVLECQKCGTDLLIEGVDFRQRGAPPAATWGRSGGG